MCGEQTRREAEYYGFPFLDYLKEYEIREDYPVLDSEESTIPREVTGTFAERLKILKEAIEDIDTEIGIRKNLSHSLNDSMRESRDWLLSKIRRFDDWQFGFKASVDLRRTSLEREILGVYRELRTEQQRIFSDIASLKRERRKLDMDYKSLKATGKALSPD